MFKSWKRRAGSVALASSSLLQPDRISYLGARVNAAETAVVSAVEEAGAKAAATAGSEVAAASTGRAIAGTAAGATGVGGAVAVSKGCRSASSVAEIATTAERSAFAADEVYAGTRAAGRASAELEEMLARQRSASVELDQLLGRRVSIPQMVVGPAQRAVAEDVAAHRAVKEVGVELFDASGRKIAPDALSSLEENRVIEERAAMFTRKVLQELPADQFRSEESLNEALQKVHNALKPDPKFKYELDLASGKLKIKYKAPRGEISGEINAYAAARKAAISGGLYFGWRQWSPRPAATTDPGQPNAKKPLHVTPTGTTVGAPDTSTAPLIRPGSATTGPGSATTDIAKK